MAGRICSKPSEIHLWSLSQQRFSLKHHPLSISPLRTLLFCILGRVNIFFKNLYMPMSVPLSVDLFTVMLCHTVLPHVYNRETCFTIKEVWQWALVCGIHCSFHIPHYLEATGPVKCWNSPLMAWFQCQCQWDSTLKDWDCLINFHIFFNI